MPIYKGICYLIIYICLNLLYNLISNTKMISLFVDQSTILMKKNDQAKIPTFTGICHKKAGLL